MISLAREWRERMAMSHFLPCTRCEVARASLSTSSRTHLSSPIGAVCSPCRSPYPFGATAPRPWGGGRSGPSSGSSSRPECRRLRGESRGRTSTFLEGVHATLRRRFDTETWETVFRRPWVGPGGSRACHRGVPNRVTRPSRALTETRAAWQQSEPYYLARKLQWAVWPYIIFHCPRGSTRPHAQSSLTAHKPPSRHAGCTTVA